MLISTYTHTIHHLFSTQDFDISLIYSRRIMDTDANTDSLDIHSCNSNTALILLDRGIIPIRFIDNSSDDAFKQQRKDVLSKYEWLVNVVVLCESGGYGEGSGMWSNYSTPRQSGDLS